MNRTDRMEKERIEEIEVRNGIEWLELERASKLTKSKSRLLVHGHWSLDSSAYLRPHDQCARQDNKDRLKRRLIGSFIWCYLYFRVMVEALLLLFLFPTRYYSSQEQTYR